MAAPSWLRWALALVVIVAGLVGVEADAGALRSRTRGIGACGCTWPPPDYTSNGDCAPKTALCGFCMVRAAKPCICGAVESRRPLLQNAAYSKYWYKGTRLP